MAGNNLVFAFVHLLDGTGKQVLLQGISSMGGVVRLSDIYARGVAVGLFDAHAPKLSET